MANPASSYGESRRLTSIHNEGSMVSFPNSKSSRRSTYMSSSQPRQTSRMTSRTSIGGISMFSNASFQNDLPIPKSNTIITGSYMDTYVAVKPLPEMYSTIGNRTSVTNSKFNAEIKEIRDLCQIQHSHLAKFYGVYRSIEQPASLVSEYGSKGSLRDLLEDNDTSKFNLTWEMKKCLMLDVANGLNGLHKSNIKYHGFLKSTNCIVDGRLSVKIADFGLPKILTEMRQARLDDFCEADEGYLYSEEYYQTLLWMSPEKLREIVPALLENATGQEIIQIETHETLLEKEQSSDIYSFGIICQEIMYRRGTYFLGPEDNHNAEDTIRDILRNKSKPFLRDIDNLRASFDNTDDLNIPPNLRAMVNDCWEHNWKTRLSKSDSGKLVDLLNKNMHSSSLVESLLDRMEDYSCHLEDLVEERTIQFKREKERADDLLYRMLPKSVADDMKAGRQVKPKAFNNVTVFFSDIVDFSLITQKWQDQPTEIVRMLDKLYTLFDSITEQFDLYKVETIGADYMVVSGCPEPKEDAEEGYFASEIAKFSLQLMKKVNEELAKLDADSDDSIWLSNLRIGFHSGHVVAGVVGQKMPRYCLFGDTVNTASRMKSNGKAQKIHVSEQAYAELKKTGEFNIQFRGIVPLKNRGDMKCYWLEGFNKDDRSDGLMFSKQKLRNTNSTPGPTQGRIKGRATINVGSGSFLSQNRNSYGQAANFLHQSTIDVTESPKRRRTTVANNVRFTDIESVATFDDMRRESFEDELPDMVKYKDIRGHPDGTESRSNTQTSEQKESGYFSNPRSTSSKNHGMQLPTSNRKAFKFGFLN